MVIINEKRFKCNQKLQIQYNKGIASLKLCNIQCHCGASDWNTHCRYQRYVDFFGFKVKIWVVRIRCSECGKTHAILFECMIPYSCINQDEAISIFDNQLCIDSSHLHFLKSKWTYELIHNYQELCKSAARGNLLMFLSIT